MSRKNHKRSRKRLSTEARDLLDSLIHGSEEWWRVVPDVTLRGKALDELHDLNLIELQQGPDGPTAVRATVRGLRSNQLAIKHDLVDHTNYGLGTPVW